MNVVTSPANDDRVPVAVIPPDPAARCYWPRGWPWSDFLELAALDPAAGSARGHAVTLLHEWGMRGAADDVAQVMSELVSNAVAATRAGRLASTVGCWMLGGPAKGVMLAVWDGSLEPPVRTEAGPLAESGRGLAIIDFMTRGRWGYYFPLPSHGGGKIVWARCALERRALEQCAAQAPDRIPGSADTLEAR
jgi:hypothetical protein